jgi:hypothetical protein
MSEHARLSPSGAHRWMRCSGSVELEATQPDDTSEYAEEGTAAHLLAAACFSQERTALAYVGRIFNNHSVDEEMAGFVQVYVDSVHQFAAGNLLMTEERVPIGHITDELGAEGTADAIIITADGEELQVHDLKYGRGVRVDAEHNEQLQLYALGVLEQFGMLGDFKRIRMVIHQPRLEHLSEWDCTLDDLLVFGREATVLARLTIPNPFFDLTLVPGEEQCRFCRAKAVCPELAKFVEKSVACDFEVLATLATKEETPQRVPSDPDLLSLKMAAVDLIEDWCKAIRAKVEGELLHGIEVPGYKLVQGRRGNRAWADPLEAEKTLKGMRLKQEEMYTFELISPTQAEKVLKETPKRWKRVIPLIVQREGQPSVAPTNDKRPALAIAPTADEFTDLTQTAEDLI